MLSVAASTLPAYTPSSQVPSYSPEPSSDELLVEHNPRIKARVLGGTRITKSGLDTVVLTNQDPNAEVPSYGRSGLITGFVDLQVREKVSEVVLKLKGKMVAIIERGSVSNKVLDESYVLWPLPSQNAAAEPCAGSVPFSVVLPAKFQRDDHAKFPLPASYNASFITMGGSSIKIAYTHCIPRPLTLSVVVTRNRGRKFAALLSSKNTTNVPFLHTPLTRPARPIPSSSSSFLADLKVMPDEWRQSSTVAHARPQKATSPSGLASESVDLDLFTPTAGVFALKDAIPIHVQLAGSLPSLREFIDSTGGTAQVEVTLVRQLLIQIQGCLEPTRQTLGRVVLDPTPPSFSSSSPSSKSGAALDWTGSLRCMPGVTVGSFDAGVVKAQDFIVVDVRPSSSTSHFAPIRHSHSIRLVTDSWPDEYT
ncbi:hypothetical protein FB45DRAFT_933455 [Roridomyces roridus]|uniref:Arrestin-like N-terminal domain-containing protein n=1 Tax=Roridomyces roridus TaxID=1738132 RepID=A0AAD7BCQ5_9AGAR|nr:hypothetical protein FB45DRAFT_933455 [Roridomyces roridus]